MIAAFASIRENKTDYNEYPAIRSCAKDCIDRQMALQFFKFIFDENKLAFKWLNFEREYIVRSSDGECITVEGRIFATIDPREATPDGWEEE